MIFVVGAGGAAVIVCRAEAFTAARRLTVAHGIAAARHAIGGVGGRRRSGR